MIIWNEIKINETDNGFLFNGKPIFKKFVRVMSFHEEGFAAVYDESGAYHIDTTGNAIYKEKYIETFGFYDGIAAVKDDVGYFHINSLGKNISNERYLWCGNFQEEKCVVQSNQGFYHIDKTGNPIYGEKYKYVGDFKYGLAVVHTFDGKSYHIDVNGKKIYTKFFLDAQNFHKGFAVVKNQNGYFHIDKLGKELYEYRFQYLEPFYNGWALGEERNGKKIRISENGFKIYLNLNNKILKTQDIIDLINQNNKVGLFFRHSERFSGVNALIGDNILLTENGKQMAFNLGKSLSVLTSVSFFSSPIERCVQTVEEISKGMNTQKKSIIKTQMLGDPGVYFDRESKINCGFAMEKKGFHNYVRDYFQYGIADGSKQLTKASEELNEFILNNMNTDITFFNSHDFLVASFMRYCGVKYPIQSDFVDYLEGVLFVKNEFNELQYYRFYP